MLAFASLVVIVLLVLLQLTRLGYLIRATIPDRPRRRMFIASVSFLFTFVGVRVLVHRIVNHQGRFQWVVIHGTHIHHLVWGILILLLVGYGWLLDLGRTHTPISIFFSRLMSVGFGVGAALTLDEFSIWLDLEPDAYWSDAGRLNMPRQSTRFTLTKQPREANRKAQSPAKALAQDHALAPNQAQTAKERRAPGAHSQQRAE